MNIYKHPVQTPEEFARCAKDPKAPMTKDQAAFLELLCNEAGVPFNTDMSQLEAHELILALRDALKSET